MCFREGESLPSAALPKPRARLRTHKTERNRSVMSSSSSSSSWLLCRRCFSCHRSSSFASSVVQQNAVKRRRCFAFSERRRCGNNDRNKALSSSGGNDENENEEEAFERRLEAALEEARAILAEATKQARDETRRELLENFNRTFGKKKKEEGEEKAVLGKDDADRAMNIARTQSFLEIKFKMRDFEAARVAKNLALSKSVYEDCDDLMVQVDRLEKALPDVNVGKLLQNDASIVSSINVAQAVQNMMALYELGFKRERVPSMLEECPRLLLDETELSARDRIRLVTERIQSIFPDETDEGCLYAIGEEPNLLWALADLEIFDREARVDIAELPMSVQGAFFFLSTMRRASLLMMKMFFFVLPFRSSRTTSFILILIINIFLFNIVEMVVYATRRFK